MSHGHSPPSTPFALTATEIAESQAEIIAEIHSELEERTLEVPLLPSVAAEVLNSSLDDKSDAARLADLIQQDQGLASHLLRVVNSAAFRGSSEIVALQQAIARLGMERIREIALTVSLKSSFFKIDVYTNLLEDSWRHGLRTGLWAKEVSRAVRKNVEVAYLCGLLQNVGAPLIINRVAQLNEHLPDDAVVDIIARFAPQAGLILVEEWALPSAVGLAIRFQGDFGAAQNAKDLVATVDASSQLANLAAIHDEEDKLLEGLVEQILQLAEIQHLNFYPDGIEALLAHASAIDATVGGMA